MRGLSLATLSQVSPIIGRPRYDPSKVRVGILHLGIGRFHRAHEASYVDELMNLSPVSGSQAQEWGICGVSLQSPRARDQLVLQDGLYTLGETRPESTRFRILGSVREVLFAPDSADALINRFRNSGTKIISLTITEKGYCRKSASGGLDHGLPSIQHDLAYAAVPQTALGWLALGLRARMDSRGGPVTVLSCDNLSGNGKELERVLREYCSLKDPELLSWLTENVSFPCSMVDRIVPEMKDEAASALSLELGYRDQCPILTESFSQWVIEDRFMAGRPDWERVGVQFCDDVAPFETLKLRLLNGSHSTMAYLGLLAGLETVDQAIRSEPIKRLVSALMSDSAPDQGAYQKSLLERFANPSLRHRLSQIAMDGSQKLPPRILIPALGRLQLGLPVGCHALALAAWICFVKRELSHGVTLADPLAGEIGRRLREDATDPAGALLSMPALLGDASGQDAGKRLLQSVREACVAIESLGSLEAARRCLA